MYTLIPCKSIPSTATCPHNFFIFFSNGCQCSPVPVFNVAMLNLLTLDVDLAVVLKMCIAEKKNKYPSLVYNWMDMTCTCVTLKETCYNARKMHQLWHTAQCSSSVFLLCLETLWFSSRLVQKSSWTLSLLWLVSSHRSEHVWLSPIRYQLPVSFTSRVAWWWRDSRGGVSGTSGVSVKERSSPWCGLWAFQLQDL